MTTRNIQSRTNNWAQRFMGLVVLVVVMMAMPFAGWGQSEGLYYIDNNTNHTSGTSGRYYLIPADDPQQTNKNDAFYSSDYNAQNGNPAKPFLTTYKTNKDEAEVPSGVINNLPNNSVWIWEAVTDESGFFYIIHASSGKYVVYEPPYSAKPNRKSMHLLATNSPGENAKFKITVKGNGYNIRPKSVTSGNMYFNPSGSNQDHYHGNGGTDGVAVNYIGLLGLWSGADGNSIWYTESTHLAAPTISDVDGATNTFTITDVNSLPSGYTIRYTTGDGTQAEPTATTGNIYSGPVIVESNWTVKAVVVRYGLVLTAVAEKAVSPLLAMPVISFDNSTNMVSISCPTPGAVIYYNTGDGSQADPTTGSTQYTAPFGVSTPTTVKAISSLSGFGESAVVSLAITQVATPTIQNNGNNAISITSSTTGATIYYTTDGSTPTASSTEYTGPLMENVSGVTIKAIAVKVNMINSAVGSGSVTLRCATPVIARVGLTFTLSCSMPTNATLYYRIGSGSETDYNGPVPFTIEQLPMTVTAVARHANYTESEAATLELINGQGTPEDPYLIYSDTDFANFISNVNAGTTSSACYKLGIDVSASGTAAITTDFTGTFDGNSYTINNLTHPLFNTVDGGVVRNVTLKNVDISSTADTIGAIVCIAKGYTRIYNCGILPNTADFPDGTHPSVVTTGNCAGGLVGSLRNDSRVINCYSYADVSAAETASGIVGRNTFASTAAVTSSKYTKLRTAVVNNMFYGNILGGTNQYGVYGGELITNAANTGISSYNYYRKGTSFTTTSGEPTAYNCSFPADERYLTQVEFHRSLLNSNRELCGWWVGSDEAPSTMTTTDVQAIPKDASLMYKWVVDPNLAPYPILKPFGKYPSIVNGNTGTPWFDRNTANPYEGKQLGTLSVTVKSGDHSTANDQTLDLPITDMDTLHYDFGYRKVQLPYFNTVFGNPDGATWAEKYAGNYSAYVVTGWKVTSVTGGTQGSFVAHWQDGYNFADRKCTDKDLYNVSGRVFAQGGNYYVPDGVTAITIEAYWADAIYVRNEGSSYDRVNVTEGATGTHFTPAGTRPTLGNGQTVYTNKIRDVIDNISQKKTVYDYAIVLVGNVQESNSNNAVTVNDDNTRGFTIMSADLDFDEEPDYCLEWQLGTGTTRNTIAPIRFDFLPVVELGIAGKRSGSTNFFSLGCFRSHGHFEVTETGFIRFGQFEFELKTRDEGPIILNGGIFDQYTRGRNDETNQHINYVIVGGHVVMPSFTPGAHVGAKYQTRHCAVNALGGDFTSFYLTGGYREDVDPYDDNPHCYIDGGRFGTIAAAYKEGIKGDVTWRINHALIREFYGGGVMSDDNKIVKGSIDVVIDNSIVGKYCGGPKFGDMVSGKTVTTSATGTTFGQFFGAGNGGTNYVQYANYDNVAAPITSVNTWESTTVNSNYHPGKYRSRAQGYEADYDYEVINTSAGTQSNQVVNRCYYYSAQFATTNTGNVTSTLTDCTVKKNFYGGGFLGGVTGTITSTLTDTHVMGSAFGAGYSASAGTVIIHNKDKNPPVANTYTGMITYNPGGTSTTYDWTHDEGTTDNPVTGNKFYTEVPLENLGAVSSNVTLTIKGNSVIGTEGESGTGNVYGGGDQSTVNGNTSVILGGNTNVCGNVYGGGNNGSVGGDSEVRIVDE